jgi:RNA ligase
MVNKMFFDENKFPVINHIDELREQVKNQHEIRFTENEFGFTVVCYAVAFAETFHSENKKWARECRGITFDPKGNIHSRPLHKFFNIGECEETQNNIIEPHLNKKSLLRVMDKRDGSMVHPVFVNGVIMLKTKKSFTSDVAIAATEFMRSDDEEFEIESFCHDCLLFGFTPIFEFTAPTNRIVLLYDKPELRLLHVRHTVSGEYVKDLKKFCLDVGYYRIPSADEYKISSFSNKFLKNSLENDTEKEGYVIQFHNGEMVKGKTKWYLDLHHSAVFLRERDIAEMVVNETVDDFKSFLNSAVTTKDENDLPFKQLKAVEKIEHQVMEEIRSIEEEIDEAFSKANLTSTSSKEERKVYAMAHNREKWFKAVMAKIDGKEFDVGEYFLKNILKKKFSLDQI